MKEMSKVGVAKLGRKFLENISEKNRSDEDNFFIQKKYTFLPKRDINSDLCIFITRRNILHISAHGF